MKTINFLDSRTPEERKGELKPVTTFAQFSNMETINELRKKYIKKIKLSSKQKRELWGEKISRQ